MKKIILVILTGIILSSCAQSNKTAADYGYQHTIIIKSYDTVKNWELVPVSIQIKPALEAGDVLILKHRENEIAKVYIKGRLKIDRLRFRIRTLGTGSIVVFVHKPDGTQSVWSKNIVVNKYGKIPENNTQKLAFKKRGGNGAVDIIINNDSAKNGFVKKATFSFPNGDAIICGSQYLSPNPYMQVSPVNLVGKPKFKIELAKNKHDKCDL